MAEEFQGMTVESIKEHMAHLHTPESFTRALIEALCVAAISQASKGTLKGTVNIPIKATIDPGYSPEGACTKTNPCMEFCIEVGGSKLYYNLGRGCPS